MLVLIAGGPVFAPAIALLIIFVFTATWATDPLAKEKARGTLESLLATPLTAKSVWMGKTLSIFLPAYIIGAVVTLAVILSMNLGAITPATGQFVFLPPQGFTSFVFLPLFLFALVSLGVMLSLITNPVIGQTVVILVGVILLQVIGQVSARVLWLLASWDYALYALAGAALLGAIVFYLSRSLNKEKIVLSSKGKWA